MKICYVDESGCTGVLPTATSSIQPAFVIAAIIVDYGKLHAVTESFLQLKQRFYPNLFSADRRRFLAGILEEIKGSELRKLIVHGSRNQRRHTFGFMDGVFNILERDTVLVTGRVWVKEVATPIDGQAVYTFSIQSIYQVFQEYLRAANDLGIVVLDSRWQHVNRQVAHSIFTQKFRMSGDAFDRIIDMPAFAHSENHAGLQIADLLASGVIFPMATYTYCLGSINNLHVQPKYSRIKDRYKDRLGRLQYRYAEASGRRRGGIIVSDALGKKSGSLLFQ